MHSITSDLAPLQGFIRHNTYIATQGPLQNTLEDFWRMVWESKSKIIVMLCNLEEGSSQQYWPSHESESVTYGDVVVTLQSETAHDDFTVRKINVQCNVSIFDCVLRHY